MHVLKWQNNVAVCFINALLVSQKKCFVVRLATQTAPFINCLSLESRPVQKMVNLCDLCFMICIRTCFSILLLASATLYVLRFSSDITA